MKKIILVLFVFTLVGCSTVFKGTKQTLTFTSSPSKAQVIIDGRSMGVTPLSISLKKNKYDVVIIKKKGYDYQTMPLDKSYDVTTLLSIFWDLSTTDLLSGAAYEYEPNNFHFVLEKEGADLSGSSSFESRVQHLVLGFGDDIRYELVTEPNEALNTLVHILESQTSRKVDLQELSTLSASTNNNLEFSEVILAEYTQ